METLTLASIDIGSNAARLLIRRIEADGLEDGERICVVFFRFRAEAGNHIGGNRAVRDDFADFGNAVQVPLTAVFAPHLLEYPVGA